MYFGFDGITVAYGKRTVLRSLTLEVPQGKILTLIGPNGCGKSSLLRTVTGAVTPCGGQVLLQGRPLSSYPARQRARQIACLPQSQPIPAGIDVRTLVSYGRYPHIVPGRGPTAADRAAVDRALALTGMTPYADRSLSTLSGGELQRARLAMNVAQEPQILLLDEPTTYLDIAYQLEIMELVRDLNRTLGLTVLMVLHDINAAARYSDLICTVGDGTILHAGTPDEVITSEVMRRVFGIEAEIGRDPTHGCPHVIPLSSIKENAI